MDSETTRRTFLRGGTLATAGLLAVEATTIAQEPQAQPGHEHAGHLSSTDYPRDRPGLGGPVGSPTDRGMLVPGLRPAGEAPVPVIVPDLPEKLPWRLVNGAKEFHIRCQAVKREFLPGLYMDVWGYNGLMPGPTIEAVEGDRVRLVVNNDLPEFN